MNKIMKTLSMMFAMGAMLVGNGINNVETKVASAATGSYVKVIEPLSDWSGNYLIVYETGAVALNGSLTTLDAVGNTISVEIVNDSIAYNETTMNSEFTISPIDGGYSIQAKSGKYIGATGNSNTIASSDTALLNTINFTSADEIDIIASGTPYLRYNATANQIRFRYYKAASYTNQKAIQLYKYTSSSAEPAATLESISLSGDMSNKSYYYGEKEWDYSGLTAIGTYSDSSTKDLSSVVTYSSDLELSNLNLGNNQKINVTATFNGVTSNSIEINNINIINRVYTLVTDLSEIAIGDNIIIVAKDNDYALSTKQNTNNRARTSVSKDNNDVFYTPEVQMLTLEEGASSNTFALNTGNGYLYAAGGTQENNHLKTTETLDIVSSWTIEIAEDGNATIKSADETVLRNTMRYNGGSSCFSCYATGQGDIAIYKFSGSSNLDSVIAFANSLNTCTDYDQAATLREMYNALSEEEKAIFDATKVGGYTLAHKLAYMEQLAANETASSNANNNLFTSLNNSSNTSFVLIIGVMGLMAIAAYYFLNKKKVSC